MTVLSAASALIAAIVPVSHLPVSHLPVSHLPVSHLPAAAPERVCRVTDDRLVEISGLVTDGAGYVVVNDGADEDSGRRIFFLDRGCKVTRALKYPSRPRDTEDLARGSDGTLWVGDIGDNNRERTTIAVWRLAPGANSPELLRMSYPDGAHDAEALLVAGDGTPVVITKDPFTAGLYVPDGPLKATSTTPMRRAGVFGIPVTGTDNPFGFRGRLVVTGAGSSPDGRRVALRTYADAFELDVAAPETAAGLIQAISEGSPRRVELPNEPQGESIAYSTDGTALLTVSEVTGQSGDDGVPLLRYALPDAPRPVTPASPAAPATTAPSPAPAAARADPPAAESAAASAARRVPAGAIIAGLGLAVAAVAIAVIAARRRRPAGRASGR
ncbi:hypothetical protein Ait01nite_076990 [Actinoplanes italicus]|uniref:Esterase-like activity of phytase family protein n=1 Tax=Actinoplanes italicus TaxID=113567 RepID=A0A2T0JZ38_9ACTN|nr:hypothetical protein [Actinoplanes italicus]PRX14789.1 hypothetical protein CLV67_123175 [Actinoplanes italicus]GIE34654.1 hypothetical protein Ait01nite_076990 [Actinoplanes italicus]